MSTKRFEERSVVEPTSRIEETGLQLAVARTAFEAANPPEKKATDDEKLSLFWRVFGGTLLSIGALVVVTLFNNMSSSISELRGEVLRSNEARMAAITELRNDLSRANDARADLIRKDEFNSRVNSNSDRIQLLQQQNNTQNATLTSLKTEQDGFKERLGKVVTDFENDRKEDAATVELLKKEIQATSEAIKKDIASLELVRERTMNMATELKAMRDDLYKVRQEVDRNQTQDLERRDRRDAQMKSLEENMKELTKLVQECREKLARLDALTSPAAPTISPKKLDNGKTEAGSPTTEVLPKARPAKKN